MAELPVTERPIMAVCKCGTKAFTLYFTENESESVVDWICPQCEIVNLKLILQEANDCIEALMKVTDEYADEFIKNKKAVDWGFVNEAFIRAAKWERQYRDGF
jgi:hypothetical protein